MKRYGLAILIALILITGLSSPALAYIANPDSSPTIDEIHIYRHILETDDMFIFFKEDTPYATPPTDAYDVTYVWQLYDPTDTFEIAQAVGYNYNDNGYNENIIGFYFGADDAPDWGEAYYLKLNGTPIGFSSPPTYQFPIEASDYSSINSTSEVLAAISNQVIEWAIDLNVEWGLASADYLTMAGETGTVLSFDGQTFFRGAVYGIQSLAPYAFDLQILDITNEPREWDDEYSGNLSTAYAGTYIGDAEDAGNDMLGTSYNLFGLLTIMGICGALIGSCVYVGGDLWGSGIFATGVIVIGGRMAMIGLGELGLVAALMWLFIAGKVWKVF